MGSKHNSLADKSTKSLSSTDLFRLNFETLQKTSLKLTDKIRLFSSVSNPNPEHKSIGEDWLHIECEIARLVQSKCQTLAHSSGLLFEAAEFVRKNDTQLNRLQSTIRKLSRENMELKANISYTLEKIQEMYETIAMAQEEIEFYKFIRSLDQVEYEKLCLSDDDETWSASKLYDSRWNAEFANSWFEYLDEIYQKIDTNLGQDAKTMVQTLFSTQIEDKATLATLIESLARRCYENSAFEDCLNLLLRVLELRSDVYGSEHPIISTTENCLALTYAALKDPSKATDLACEALNKLEKHPGLVKNKSVLFHQYTRTGQMLIGWGQLQQGLRFMQLSLASVEDLLPKEEQYWCDLLQRMARTCNDNGYHDDAMVLSCEIIDYFHERHHGLISDSNLTIYEVAHQYQLENLNTKSETLANWFVPKPMVLNKVHANALREIAIAFACRFEFRAAQFIEIYLKMCSKALTFEEDIVFHPKRFNSQLKRYKIFKPQIIQHVRSKSNEKRSLFKNLSSIFKLKR